MHTIHVHLRIQKADCRKINIIQIFAIFIEHDFRMAKNCCKQTSSKYNERDKKNLN